MDKEALRQTVRGHRLTPQEIEAAAERLRKAMADRRVSDPPEDDVPVPGAPGEVSAVAYGGRRRRG